MTLAQHFRIVITFNDHSIQLSQDLGQSFEHVSDICQDTESTLAMLNHECNTVECIMGRRDGVNLNLPKIDRFTRFEEMQTVDGATGCPRTSTR